MIAGVQAANALATRLLAPIEPLLLLGLRVYVAWQFLKSGWLKATDWETTRFLFEEEYRVPLLSPAAAAALGTAGELIFPVLLIAGFLGRYAALGLSAVNVTAVIAYAHVLLGAGFEAALAQHVLWGVILLVLLVAGPGTLALDAWVRHRYEAQTGGRG